MEAKRISLDLRKYSPVDLAAVVNQHNLRHGVHAPERQVTAGGLLERVHVPDGRAPHFCPYIGHPRCPNQVSFAAVKAAAMQAAKAGGNARGKPATQAAGNKGWLTMPPPPVAPVSVPVEAPKPPAPAPAPADQPKAEAEDGPAKGPGDTKTPPAKKLKGAAAESATPAPTSAAHAAASAPPKPQEVVMLKQTPREQQERFLAAVSKLVEAPVTAPLLSTNGPALDVKRLFMESMARGGAPGLERSHGWEQLCLNVYGHSGVTAAARAFYLQWLAPLEAVLPSNLRAARCTEALDTVATGRAATAELERRPGAEAAAAHARQALSGLPEGSAGRDALRVLLAAARGAPADIAALPLPPWMDDFKLVGERRGKSGKSAKRRRVPVGRGALANMPAERLAAGAALLLSRRALRSGPPGVGQPPLELGPPGPLQGAAKLWTVVPAGGGGHGRGKRK